MKEIIYMDLIDCIIAIFNGVKRMFRK